MPAAHAILWFLGMFLILWATSLVLRGVFGDWARGRRRCPACFGAIADAASRSCVACGYEARTERALLAPRRSWRMITAGSFLAPVGVLVCYFGLVVWSWTHMNHDVGLALTIWNSSAVALAVFGAIIIGWAIRGERSRGRRRCPRCWYDMTGSGLRCPECGHESRHTSDLYRPRRRWKAAALASLLLVGAAAVHGVPRVQRGGWRAVFPSTALIAALPWLPDALVFELDPNADEDWTLVHRAEAGRLWGWQQKWLGRRSRGVLASALTAREVLRAINFLPIDQRSPATRRTFVLCVRALGSASKAERDAAVTCVSAFSNVLVPPSDSLAAGLIPIVPDLIRIIKDDQQSSDVVWSAIWAVSLTGSAAAPAVPRMMALASKAGRVRMFGMVGPLRNLAIRSPEAKAAVILAVDDPDLALAQVACAVLATYSLCDEATAQVLLRVLDGDDDARAAAAASALCRALWRPHVVIPAVLAQAARARPARAPIVEPLWSYEDSLLPYLSQLAELLEDPDPTVRCAALGIIGACTRQGHFTLSRSAAYPIIAALRNDPDPNVSLAARTLVDDDAAANR